MVPNTPVDHKHGRHADQVSMERAVSDGVMFIVLS